MNSQPELTVILTAYNVEKYLARALDHLAKQTESNFKLLIINDGSKDNTASIAVSYQEKFRYFELINKKNTGIARTRNVGLDHVDTPYFTFHDGDDFVDADYVANLLNMFHEHPQASMVCCGFYLDDDQKKTSVTAGKKKIKKLLSQKEAYRLIINPLGSFFMNKLFVSPVKGYTWNKGYKTAIVKRNNLRFVEKLTFMEDEIFTIAYLSLTGNCYCDSTAYYHYCQRSDSIIHSFSFKMLPDNVKANYLLWKIIFKSLGHKTRSSKVETGQLITANKVNNNDREG